MDGQTKLSIIHRKARVAREDFDARAMSPAKAMRLALAKSADDLFGLALTVSTLEQTDMSAKSVLSGVAEGDLLLLLDGAGGERGAVMADCQLVSALIEMQISGHVRKAEAAPRPYTRTDAAMMSPLVDDLMRRFDAHLAEAAPSYRPRAFRFGDKIEDARALSLALSGDRFDMFNLTLDIADGAKTGSLRVAVPRRPPVRAEPGAAVPAAQSDAHRLEQVAMNAEVVLDAVIARMELPLNRICALKKDMVIPLSPEALSQSELLAPPRHLVAPVRLGQVNGMRAVRIMLPERLRPVPARRSAETAPPAGEKPRSAKDPGGSVTLGAVQYSNVDAALPVSARLGDADPPEPVRDLVTAQTLPGTT